MNSSESRSNSFLCEVSKEDQCTDCDHESINSIMKHVCLLFRAFSARAFLHFFVCCITHQDCIISLLCIRAHFDTILLPSVANTLFLLAYSSHQRVHTRNLAERSIFRREFTKKSCLERYRHAALDCTHAFKLQAQILFRRLCAEEEAFFLRARVSRR